MKKIALLFGILSLALVSCQEVNDLIIYPPPGQNDILTIDTAKYPAVAALPKNVLIEDFTGVQCDNCPNAQAESVNIVNSNPPGRVVVMAIHCTKSLGAPFPGHPDYRTANGTSLVNYLFGGDPGSLPIGDVDRKLYVLSKGSPPTFQIPYAFWPFYVDSELAQTPKAAIAFNNKYYDGPSRTLSMDITTTFPAGSTDDYYVSAAVIESGFVDWQQTNSSTEPVNKNFVFEHVLRKLMIPYNGLNIANAPAAGTTYNARFKTVLDHSWNADSCKVVAFVHHRSLGNNSVEQVIETTVK